MCGLYAHTLSIHNIPEATTEKLTARQTKTVNSSAFNIFAYCLCFCPRMERNCLWHHFSWGATTFKKSLRPCACVCCMVLQLKGVTAASAPGTQAQRGGSPFFMGIKKVQHIVLKPWQQKWSQLIDTLFFDNLAWFRYQCQVTTYNKAFRSVV